MQKVWLFKPDGSTIEFGSVKRMIIDENGTLTLYLEGADAFQFGSEVKTNMPFLASKT